jgi:hypothetical protein
MPGKATMQRQLAPQRSAQILHGPRERIHFAFQFPDAITGGRLQFLFDRFYAPTGAAHLERTLSFHRSDFQCVST